MSYREKVDRNWAKLIPTHSLKKDWLPEVLKSNTKTLRDSREGAYLLKRYDDSKIDTYPDKYISFGYRHDGWLVFSTRDNAQWFSRDEVREILSDKRIMPLKVVRRSPEKKRKKLLTQSCRPVK